MATHDVPGSNPSNNDVLKHGCWAEHADGSLLYVQTTENSRVVYELFDLTDPDDPVCYRDAMPIGDFYKAFSWDDKKMTVEASGKRLKQEKWLWHDKTPFDWDRVIDPGHLKKGVIPVSAQQQLSAAARIAESLKLRREKIDQDQLRDKIVSGNSIVGVMKDKLSRAFRELSK